MTNRQKEVTVGPLVYFTYDGINYHVFNHNKPALLVSGTERDFINLAKEIHKRELEKTGFDKETRDHYDICCWPDSGE